MVRCVREYMIRRVRQCRRKREETRRAFMYREECILHIQEEFQITYGEAEQVFEQSQLR